MRSWVVVDSLLFSGRKMEMFISFPVLITFLVFQLSRAGGSYSGESYDLFYLFHRGYISSFVSVYKYVLLFNVALFVVYPLTVVRRSGELGNWLLICPDRRGLFLTLSALVVGVSVLSFSLASVLVVYSSGVYVDVTSFLNLLLTCAVKLSLLVVLGLVVALFVSTPEVAFSTYVALGYVLSALRPAGSELARAVSPESFWHSGFSPLSLSLLPLTAVMLWVSTLRFEDMEVPL